MLRCKQVADALAKHRYWELPWYRRWGLRMHASLCLMCGHYHRHVILMQDVAQRFADRPGREKEGEGAMSEETRKRLKDRIGKTP